MNFTPNTTTVKASELCESHVIVRSITHDLHTYKAYFPVTERAVISGDMVTVTRSR